MFKNPEFNAVKIVILVIIIAVAGYFVWKYGGDRDTAQEGRVINTQQGTSVNTSGTSTTNIGGDTRPAPKNPGPASKAICQATGVVYETTAACNAACGSITCYTY